MKFIALLILIAAQGFGQTHQNLKPVNKTAPQLQAPSENSIDGIYLEAEKAFLSSQFNIAQENLEKILKLESSSATSKTLARAHNLKGLIFFQLKNLSSALDEFEIAQQISSEVFAPNDPSLHLVRYNYANALFQFGKTQNAEEMIEKTRSEYLDKDTKVRFFHLNGNIAIAQEKPLNAVEAYIHAAASVEEITLENLYVQRAYSASKQLFLISPESDVQKLMILSDQVAEKKNISSALNLILARGQMYLGNHAEAKVAVSQFISENDSSHPLYKSAQELSEQIDKLSVVEPQTVGLLIPLTGKFAKFGRLCLNAILLAHNSFEEMPANLETENIRLVIRDSGETVESAMSAFDSLVFAEHAIAVIGPLLSKQGTPVAQKAQEYGVPLFSLSQKNERSKLGSFVFPIALSPLQQIQIIVDYARNTRHYERFAILAPSDSFGDEYVKLFWDSVEASGGKIMGVERYAPKSTDFKEELKSLLGLNFLDARELEMQELNRRSEMFASKLKAKGLTRKRMLQAFDPGPIIQFDAVFVPDDPQVVGQLAPSFAVLGIDHLPFLGINTWNNMELVQRTGRYVQNSLFVDAFYAQSRNQKVQKFVETYRKFFGGFPGTIEVQAFDAASIVFKTVASTLPQTRSQLQNGIFSVSKFIGASGDFEFTPAHINRSAYLLTVQGNNIVETQE